MRIALKAVVAMSLAIVLIACKNEGKVD